ncbi:hypothetical protein Hanom_Chr03g00198241 [Helianthus anomalus]
MVCLKFLWTVNGVFDYRMTNISVFYVDYHVLFYIYSSTMVCLKFLCTVNVWILCLSDLYSVICEI